MKTRTQELWVGVFVVMAVAALFFLALRVSGLVSLFGKQDSYELTAHFNNIGGLTPRAKVTMSGVTIGSVKSIQLDQKRLDAKVILSIDNDTKVISTDSYASIMTAGLLGEQFIGIEPGADDKYLQNGDEITLTQSAMVLEDLIGKFVFNKTTEPVAAAPAKHADGVADGVSKSTAVSDANTASTATSTTATSDSFASDDSFGDF